MSAYPHRQEIREWVEWARRYLPSEGDIPPIDWNGPEANAEPPSQTFPEGEGAARKQPPWIGASQGLLDEEALGGSESKREDMLGAFAEAISADLRDLPPRFAALHFYYNLASTDWPEFSIYNKDLYESAQAAFRHDLRVLLGMLPVEECPHDWRRFKWEISNSLAAEDWDRARQLYNLAEAFNILEAKDLWVLRGQFNFFLALAKDEVKRPRACHWLLSVNPPGDGFGSYLTSRSCWLALVEAPEKLLQGSLNEKAQGILLDARNDLEKAFRSRTDLGSPYHLMLGTCYLALSDYARATGEYKKVLSLERKFEHIDFDVLALLLKKVRPQVGEDLVDVLKRAIKGDPTGVVWDFKPELFHVLAESCARGAKPSDAEAVYRQWAQEYPRDPRVYRHLASLLAQETKHKEAYEALRKEIELRPEAEKEPGYSIALALGGIAAEHIDLDRVTRQTLEKHPELEKLLDLLFLDIWPTYGRLSDEARGIWRFASIQTYYNPVILPTLARQYRQTGAVQFAKAVEIELRQRVFEGFKSEARGDAAIVTVAEEAKKDQNAGRFAEFLVGKGKLALGEMAFILREARLGKGELFKHFGEWTRQHFPSLDEGRLEVLKKICIPRNLETHTTALLDVKEVPNDCRGFLDALLAC